MNSKDKVQSQFIKLLGASEVKVNEPLKNHTYMKIGGPADIFVETSTLKQLIRTYRLAQKLKLPIFILGGGSNIVASDKGFRGLVIKNRADEIKLIKSHGSTLIEAQSGVITNLLVRHVIDKGFKGLEYFLGVPGTVGGAIYNNSHYQSQLIGDYIKDITVLDKKGQEKTYTSQQLDFSYDYSLIQKTKELILSARFALKHANKDKLLDQATDFAKLRASTQPLSQPSSGCMFKNITKSQAKTLGVDKITTGAGYLIDKAGLKGTRVGNVMISDKHANFIVNLGGGTSKDVKTLVQLIRQKIKEKYGFELKTEVFFVEE